jgi:hypothetical protein
MSGGFMKVALVPLLLVIALPRLVWGDTVELNQLKVSVVGNVTFQKGTFRLVIDGGKVVPLDASEVRKVQFDNEKPSKKPPVPSGRPIKRGLEPPQWRIELKSGGSKTGILEKIDEATVVVQGEKGIPRSEVSTLTLVLK